MDLRVNDVYVFDPDNKLNIAGNAYTYCRITKIEPGFFRSDVYVVFCDKDGNLITDVPQRVNPSLLKKLNENEYVVTRYPHDTPIINESEVEAISNMYQMVLLDPLGRQIDEKDKITIAKLICKLQLFSKVFHQY